MERSAIIFWRSVLIPLKLISDGSGPEFNGMLTCLTVIVCVALWRPSKDQIALLLRRRLSVVVRMWSLPCPRVDPVRQR